MQRLTDDGATQKLPPGGLNAETAQGDTMPTVTLLSPPCFALYAPSVAHCNTLPLLSVSLGLRYIISVLFSAPRRTVVVVVQRCEVCKSHKGLCVSSAVSETEM